MRVSPNRNQVAVSIGARELQLSNLEKPLYPTGFTKGDMLDYYARIAPAMLPHLKGRPVTVKRFPEGVEHAGFIEKNVARSAPDWIRTVPIPRRGADRSGGPKQSGSTRVATQFVVVDELATLMWLVNLASIEFHTPMWRIGQRDQPRQPDLLVFDLDPGPPAHLAQCCQIALLLRDQVTKEGIELLPKTSGSKGMQLYAGITSKRWSAERTKTYAHALAEQLEQSDPDLAVSRMAKTLRPGKVLIDWSQNSATKTTVSPYSLRALGAPTVSTPLSWDEVEAGAGGDDGWLLGLSPEDVLERVRTMGDLFESLGS
jgi:bifunctional non-homologous end joining protein LigD